MAHHSKSHHDYEEGALETAYSISDFAFDTSETLVLELLRHFCLCYAAPASQAWTVAFKRAEQSVGHVDGPALALNVSELLNALRGERDTPFGFIDPNCAKCAQRIFATEVGLMLLVRGALRNDALMMQKSVEAIVEDSSGVNTIASAHALAAFLKVIEIQRDHKKKAISGRRSLLH